MEDAMVPSPTGTALRRRREPTEKLSPDLERRIAVLPRLASIVADFLVLARNEFLSAHAFEEVLARDRVLERWLLRQANSGFFHLSRPIAELSDALVVIGLERLKRMVYAVASRELLDRRLRRYRYPGDGYWLHALAVATTARSLVEATPAPSAGAPPAPGGRLPLGPEEAFVAGLLHDLGKRVLDDLLPAAGTPRTFAPAEERAVCGIDHARLSARIAAIWDLPGRVLATIAGHHDRVSANPVTGGALVALADDLCNSWGLGPWTYPRTRADFAVAPWRPLIEELGFDEVRWERWLESLRPVLEGLAEMLRLCRVNPVVELPSDAASDQITADRSSAPSVAADRRSGRRRRQTRRDRSSCRATRGTRRGRGRRDR
jgi:HD-like signal output (HDOD) protein